jgi:hypothetical protein
MDDQIECLEVRRDDLRSTRLASDDVPDLERGQVLLRVDRFGLTANNVTYGVAGDMIGYWRFFPTDDPQWGRLPVWGFAEVAAGEVDGCPLGARVFGYFPMATHLVVEPDDVRPGGFTDGSAHRSELPGTYNRYRRTDTDPGYRPDTEDQQAIFVPLFVTSFVLDDYLADQSDFGAERVIVSSASSKTAAGMALCTSRREGPRPALVGLTSPGNVAFVEQLGWYDQVVTYDEVGSLDADVPSVFVDIAGDATVRAAVHRHLGDRLLASLTVGMTHWEATADTAELPGPEPQFFFAPTQIEKRIADWGPAGYQERFGAAWEALLAVADDWIDVVPIDGLAALPPSYERLLDGSVRPDEAFIVTP